MSHTVQETIDYNKFKLFDFNRKIIRAHVLELAESIKRENRLHVCPVIVDQDYKIYDGQHRVEACKMLNIPVQYVVLSNSKVENALIDANAFSRPWRLINFLDCYAIQGYPEYVKMRECMELYRLPFGIVHSLHKSTLNSKATGNEFRQGQFRFSEQVEIFLSVTYDTIQFMRKFLDKDRKKILTNAHLYLGLFDFFKKNPNKLDKILGLIRDQVFDIPDFGSYKEYIKFFDRLYTTRVLKKKVEV